MGLVLSDRAWSGAFALSMIVLVATMIALKRIDSRLPHPAQKLEWVRSKAKADAIQYGPLVPLVDKALLIDSLLFVPAYVAALMLALSRAGHPRLMWLMPLAGVLDWIENAGIYVEVHRGATHLAPYVYTVAMLKWTIAIAGMLVVLARVAMWVLSRA